MYIISAGRRNLLEIGDDYINKKIIFIFILEEICDEPG